MRFPAGYPARPGRRPDEVNGDRRHRGSRRHPARSRRPRRGGSGRAGQVDGRGRPCRPWRATRRAADRRRPLQPHLPAGPRRRPGRAAAAAARPRAADRARHEPRVPRADGAGRHGRAGARAAGELPGHRGDRRAVLPHAVRRWPGAADHAGRAAADAAQAAELSELLAGMLATIHGVDLPRSAWAPSAGRRVTWPGSYPAGSGSGSCRTPGRCRATTSW